MYYAEQVATVEEVHHIGSTAEFHSIKINGHDVRMQNDTGSSVTIISTKIGRKLALLPLALAPDGLKHMMDTECFILVI